MKQLYNQKRQAFAGQPNDQVPPDAGDNQMKVATAMQDQRRALESENSNLRSRLQGMEND
jgi:hypothetical protein|tara:strand:+ start:1108 stop:1287 length:180 start_codon:yes stop_codon:yes gene_type:complete